MSLCRNKLFSSERQYYWCYIALHNAAWNPHHLTGIRNHYSVSCCLSLPPFGSSIFTLTCSWRSKIFLFFKRKVPFFKGVRSVRSQSILYSTSCPLSRAPILYSLSLPSYYSYHSISFGCDYHLIAEKECSFNKRELWYRKHTRKLPFLRTWRTEAKWSKGSD